MQREKSNDDILSNIQLSVRIMLFLTRIFSVPPIVLLHSRYGPKFVGIAGGFALFAMMTFPVFFSHSNPGPLYFLMVIYMLRCAWGRIVYLYHVFRKKPWPGHRESPGIPWVLRLFPNWNESAVTWLEPVGVFVLGVAIQWLNRPLGFYLILAGIAHFAWQCLGSIYAWNTAADLRDKALEQEGVAAQFREFQSR